MRESLCILITEYSAYHRSKGASTNPLLIFSNNQILPSMAPQSSGMMKTLLELFLCPRRIEDTPLNIFFSDLRRDSQGEVHP